MDKQGVFRELMFRVTGKCDGTSPTIIEYDSLPPVDGLSKALGYLEWAEEAQRNAKSDPAYWLYGGDISIAHVLIAIFTKLAQGQDDFPSLPDIEGKVLMDTQAALSEWAKQLLSDHEHQWESCQHTEETGKLPTHPKCGLGKVSYGGLYHSVCGICGINRYDFSIVATTGRKVLAELKQ